MNPILKNLIDNAKKREENNSSIPFVKIRAQKQDRPLPDNLKEQVDIPYGKPADGLFANVVYQKERVGSRLPVVVFVHGGGLVTGDRQSDRVFCQEFARRGFVVYSVEYRLIDRADIFGMVSDLCNALSMVKSTCESFGGDLGRVSVCGESAGAFLAIYAIAADESEALRREFHCEGHGLSVSHLILLSGMIYTAALDPISLVYKKALYKEKSSDKDFLESIDPDNPKVLSLLPPILLVSSKADFLRGHTLKFAGALKQNHHRRKVIYYKEGTGRAKANVWLSRKAFYKIIMNFVNKKNRKTEILLLL
ncbi:MAG: alpha/beta hydrolase [Butyrivibrio sp.]|nr:alpha/beta hydrolase [Butyrivibrio sp.]